MKHFQDEFDLTLSGDTFNAMKGDFNQILKKTLFNMEIKGSNFAELTVKVKITLYQDFAPDLTSPHDETRSITVPKFEHKVSSVMQIKDEMTGFLGGDYELVWDGERGEYVMRRIKTEQMTIYDSEQGDD
jgi:hypothetical protein